MKTETPPAMGALRNSDGRHYSTNPALEVRDLVAALTEDLLEASAALDRAFAHRRQLLRLLSDVIHRRAA